jgi:hypothetical protein
MYSVNIVIVDSMIAMHLYLHRMLWSRDNLAEPCYI